MSDWTKCPICRLQNSFGCGHWAWHNACLAELNPIALIGFLNSLPPSEDVRRVRSYVITVTGMDVDRALAVTQEQEP